MASGFRANPGYTRLTPSSSVPLCWSESVPRNRERRHWGRLGPIHNPLAQEVIIVRGQTASASAHAVGALRLLIENAITGHGESVRIQAVMAIPLGASASAGLDR